MAAPALQMSMCVNADKVVSNIHVGNETTIIQGIRRVSPSSELADEYEKNMDFGSNPILGVPLRYTPGLKCDPHLEALRPVRDSHHRPLESANGGERWRKKLMPTSDSFSGSFLHADLNKFRPDMGCEKGGEDMEGWCKARMPEIVDNSGFCTPPASPDFTRTKNDEVDTLDQIKLRNRRFQQSNCSNNGKSMEMSLTAGTTHTMGSEFRQPAMEPMHGDTIAAPYLVPVVYLVDPRTMKPVSQLTSFGNSQTMPATMTNNMVHMPCSEPRGQSDDLTSSLNDVDLALNRLRQANRSNISATDAMNHDDELSKFGAEFSASPRTMTPNKPQVLNSKSPSVVDRRIRCPSEAVENCYRSSPMRTADSIAIRSLLMSKQMDSASRGVAVEAKKED